VTQAEEARQREAPEAGVNRQVQTCTGGQEQAGRYLQANQAEAVRQA
jgi:hypothetical protein